MSTRKTRTLPQWAYESIKLNENWQGTDSSHLALSLDLIREATGLSMTDMSWRTKNTLWRSTMHECYSVAEILDLMVHGISELSDFTITSECCAMLKGRVYAQFDNQIQHNVNWGEIAPISHIAICERTDTVWLPQEFGINYIHVTGYGADGKTTWHHVYAVAPKNEVGLSPGYPHGHTQDSDWPALEAYTAIRVYGMEKAGYHKADDIIKRPYVCTLVPEAWKPKYEDGSIIFDPHASTLASCIGISNAIDTYAAALPVGRWDDCEILIID